MIISFSDFQKAFSGKFFIVCLEFTYTDFRSFWKVVHFCSLSLQTHWLSRSKSSVVAAKRVSLNSFGSQTRLCECCIPISASQELAPKNHGSKWGCGAFHCCKFKRHLFTCSFSWETRPCLVSPWLLVGGHGHSSSGTLLVEGYKLKLLYTIIISVHIALVWYHTSYCNPAA